MFPSRRHQRRYPGTPPAAAARFYRGRAEQRKGRGSSPLQGWRRNAYQFSRRSFRHSLDRRQRRIGESDAAKAFDRNTGEPGDKLNKIKRRRDEISRDKPVEEEGDKDIRDKRGLRR
jgi:hypothetical protein